MRGNTRTIILMVMWFVISVTRNRGGNASATASATQDDKNKDVKAQPILDDDTNIPDSLLNPRWKIQRTIPITDDDLNQGSADLQRPENMKQTVEYNDTIDRYIIGNKIGGTYVGAPIMMMSPMWGAKYPWIFFSMQYFASPFCREAGIPATNTAPQPSMAFWISSKEEGFSNVFSTMNFSGKR